MSTEVILPSPQLGLLDTGTLPTVEAMALPAVCGPHRGTRRPSGTAESESDSPPSKKSKKSRRRRKRPRKRCLRSGLRNKPEAPFNTTQFLMEEHDLLQDTDIVARPRRHRDSSFSMDSADESNQFYSSPEDEEEFLTKEFWTAYEDVHAERLDTMTKAQLVQEYLALEEKVDLLERQLRAVRARRRYRIQHQEEEEDDEEDDDIRPGEVRVDPETAQKITIFQSEISNLEVENRKLREENFALRRFSSVRSSSSSSSSSSDSSSSSSSSSSSDSSSDSEDEREAKQEGGGKLSVFQDTVVGSVIECQPDSGVSCDSAEAADPPSSSATEVTHKQSPQRNQSEVEVTSSKCGGDGGGVVEEEVSSTTTA